MHPSAFLGYRPLTVFIVPQTFRLVNTFFEISQTFLKEGSAVAPSIRTFNGCALSLDYYLYSGRWDALNPCGVKSGDFTGLTRIFAIYCRPTCGECPLFIPLVRDLDRFPYCIFIVPHRERIVKTFFKLFFKFFHLAFWRLAPLPWDNYSIAQGHMDCNRQSAQNRENLHINVCALCQLTFCAAGCIMEIRP